MGLRHIAETSRQNKEVDNYFYCAMMNKIDDIYLKVCQNREKIETCVALIYLLPTLAKKILASRRICHGEGGIRRT